MSLTLMLSSEVRGHLDRDLVTTTHWFYTLAFILEVLQSKKQSSTNITVCVCVSARSTEPDVVYSSVTPGNTNTHKQTVTVETHRH